MRFDPAFRVCRCILLLKRNLFAIFAMNTLQLRVRLIYGCLIASFYFVAYGQIN